MLIALVSGKGSPGASTAALALAMKWPRPALLVELDPRGGEVRLGYGQGIRTDGRGLVLLQDENRGSLSSRLWEEVLALGGYPDRFWLPGVEAPRQARSLDWARLADLFSESGGLGVDVIADCGSYWTERPPRAVWQAAALVALVIRPSVTGVRAAANAAAALTIDLETGGLGVERLVGLTVGGGSDIAPYPVKDVRDALPDLPIPADLDWDRRGADLLVGLRPAKRRDPKLLKQAEDAARKLLAHAAPQRTVQPQSDGPAFHLPNRQPPAEFHTARPVPAPPAVDVDDPDATQVVPGPLVDVLTKGRHHSGPHQQPTPPITVDAPSPPPTRATERRSSFTGHPAAVPPPPPQAPEGGIDQ